MDAFRAFVLNKEDSSFTARVEEMTLDDLPEGDVTIRVVYSSVNYKDGIVSQPGSRLAATYPLIPGIDLAGHVVHSTDKHFREGDDVIVTSYDLGTAHFGGFSQVARVPAEWVVPLPKGLSLKEAMIVGTAGFTSALSLQRMEHNGLEPAQGPVLVTGATGGVGSIAVAMLSKLEYEVTASSRKSAEHDFLKQVGAKEIVHPDQLIIPSDGPRALRQKWAGAVDPVAGKSLPYIFHTLLYGGTVAVSGFTGGADFASTVFPFIRQGIQLVGIDSVRCPMSVRKPLWERIAAELKPTELLERIVNEITLDELPEVLEKIMKGQIRGRTIVAL